MKKANTDPKVKKTLIRNYEQKISAEKKTAAVSAGPSKEKYSNRNELDHPTLCSSEVIAHYLSDVKKSAPPPLSAEDLRVNKSKISSKITKKLNFHFNDRIYRDLVELNADVTNKKNKKDKKPKVLTKKDQEPNIEDFCHDEKEDDLSPNIPLIKHKFKPIRSIENGQLHKLVASFEKL